jgi:hypothetical protein
MSATYQSLHSLTRLFVAFTKKLFLTVEVVNPPPNVLSRKKCLIGYLSVLIQYIHGCILCLRTVSFICVWGGGVPFRGNREVLNMAHSAVRVVKSKAVSGMVFVARVTVRLKFQSVSQEIKAQVG